MTAHAVDLKERLQEVLGSGYRIDREVGGGGMSRVFAVRDLQLNRDLIVKVLPPDLAGEVSVERFKREIQISASLQHPHIVPLHASGDVDGLPYYTMPLVVGESLRDRISRMQRMPVGEALRITRDIARALAHAHRRNVVHRDIKPENALITEGMAVVTDFGIAKAIAAARGDDLPVTTSGASGLTVTGSSLGTPNYMAPEQAAADPATDHRADLYALGVVAYELLTGAVPFEGRSPMERLAAQLSERPRDVGELRLDVPPAAAQLIMRCLEKEPAARPASADDVVAELELVIAGPAPVSADEPAEIRRAFGTYVAAFAVVVGVAWLATGEIGLPDWVMRGVLVIMALGFAAVTFTAVGRYAAFKLLRAASGGRPGPMPWQQTTGARSLWIAEHVSWRRVATGGTVAMGSFGVLVAAFMVSRATGVGPAATLLSKGTLQAQERILVTDLRVTGIDSTLAGAVTVATRTALRQSRAVAIMSSEEVADALQRMRRPRTSPVDADLGRELAQREGVRSLLVGHVIPAGNQFEVSLSLVSADSGRELVEVHRAASGPQDLIATVDALSRDLRSRIGESLKGVRATPPLPQATTNSLRALQLFAESQRASDQTLKLNLLREAIAADSEFASAHRNLWGLRFGTPEGDAALKTAVRFLDRLPERERLQVEAARYTDMALFPDANRANAIAIYQQLAAMGDQLGLTQLPELLMNRRDWVAGESLSVANIARFPANPGVKVSLIRSQIEQGKLDEAERTIEDALRKHPGTWGAEWWKVRLLYYRGRYDDFERALDSLRRLPDPQRRMVAINHKHKMAEIRGRFVERDRLRAELQSLNAAAQNQPQTRVDKAVLELWTVLDMRRPDTARAVRELESALIESPGYGGMQMWGVTEALAQAGRPDLIRFVIDRHLERREPNRTNADVFVHKMRGALAMAEKRPRDAIEEIRLGDFQPDGPWHPCHQCFYRDISRAFDAAGEADSTVVYLEKFVNSPGFYALETHPGDLIPSLRRLGELYEARGNRAQAIAWYERYVELRKNADPVFQPALADIRARIARLRER